LEQDYNFSIFQFFEDEGVFSVEKKKEKKVIDKEKITQLEPKTEIIKKNL